MSVVEEYCYFKVRVRKELIDNIMEELSLLPERKDLALRELIHQGSDYNYNEVVVVEELEK